MVQVVQFITSKNIFREHFIAQFVNKRKHDVDNSNVGDYPHNLDDYNYDSEKVIIPVMII